MQKPLIDPQTLTAYHVCEHLPTMDRLADTQEALPPTDFAAAAAEHTAVTRQNVLDAVTNAEDLSVYPADQRVTRTLDALRQRQTEIRGGRLEFKRYAAEPQILLLQNEAYVPVITTTSESPSKTSERPDRHHTNKIALAVHVLTSLGFPAAAEGRLINANGNVSRWNLHEPYGKRTIRTPWQDFEDDLAAVEAALDGAVPTQPAFSNACVNCRWRHHCLKNLEATDDLTLIPDLGRARRTVLAQAFTTRKELAQADLDACIDGNKTIFKGIGPDTLHRLQARAALTLEPDPKPYLIQAPEWPEADLDVYIAVQADPFRSVHYLHAFLTLDRQTGETTFQPFLPDPSINDGERQAFTNALAWLNSLEQPFTLYHYSPYERTAWKKLAATYTDPDVTAQVDELFETPHAIDLLKVARDCATWPGYDLSLKTLAAACGYTPETDPPAYPSILTAFRDWTTDKQPQARDFMLQSAYNHCDSLLLLRNTFDNMAPIAATTIQ